MIAESVHYPKRECNHRLYHLTHLVFLCPVFSNLEHTILGIQFLVHIAFWHETHFFSAAVIGSAPHLTRATSTIVCVKSTVKYSNFYILKIQHHTVMMPHLDTAYTRLKQHSSCATSNDLCEISRFTQHVLFVQRFKYRIRGWFRTRLRRWRLLFLPSTICGELKIYPRRGT